MSDEKNLAENRLYKATINQNQPATKGSAERQSFSKSGNKRVEVVTADPSYTWTRAWSAIPTADDAPTATAPAAANVWDLKGYQGISGFFNFTGGTSPSVDLELWKQDTTSGGWYLVDCISGLREAEEFRFSDVRQGSIFLRLSGVPAVTGVTALALICTAE